MMSVPLNPWGKEIAHLVFTENVLLEVVLKDKLAFFCFYVVDSCWTGPSFYFLPPWKMAKQAHHVLWFLCPE